jgi:polyferredoxin
MDHSKMVHHMLPDGGMVMVHGGIPGWLFGVGVGLVVLFSFVVVEWRGLPSVAGWRKNLTGPRWAHRLVRKRWFQPAMQAPIIAAFLFTLYAGLFGSGAKNIAPVLVWTIWWAALIFAVALLGNAWCFLCPWDGLTNLITRVGGVFKRKDSLSMGLEAPSWMQNLYPALVLFIALTWLELGWGITNDPRATATLGVGVLALCLTMGLVFEKKVFCQSFCFVGRISGMYSMFSPIEIRPRDERVCGVCTTRDCLTGGGEGLPCPVGIDLGKLDTNLDCTLCTECFKSCPSLAPAVRIRPPNQDFHKLENPRSDIAWLALTLLALTGFHGLSMTPLWQDFGGGKDIVGWIAGLTGGGQLASFTVGMLATIALPVAVYALCTLAAWLLTSKKVPFGTLFVAYALSVVPVALFYHLAHNAMHLFMEGPDVWPLLSDPLGQGWDLFGTADSHPDPLMSQENTWYVQVGLICVGHIAGVLSSHRIAKRLFPKRSDAVKSLLPMLAMMVLLSVCGLWLMHLDMNMRMGRM